MRHLFILYAKNKDADQPAHPRSLISIFVVSCLDSIIYILAISKFQVSLAGQAGLSHTWAQTTEDRFSCDMAHIIKTRRSAYTTRLLHSSTGKQYSKDLCRNQGRK